MKRITLLLFSLSIGIAEATQVKLTSSILSLVDGIPGVFDRKKVKNTLWLLQEIKAIHGGTIKMTNGEPDPRGGKPVDLIFNGEKQTLQELVALEKEAETLSEAERKELKNLFARLKSYFGEVNMIVLADARGAQDLMFQLISEFCRKSGRTTSLLLHWNKPGAEIEMYAREVTNFDIFYIFSTDLMNFLAALLKSCPKALEDYKASRAK